MITFLLIIIAIILVCSPFALIALFFCYRRLKKENRELNSTVSRLISESNALKRKNSEQPVFENDENISQKPSYQADASKRQSTENKTVGNTPKQSPAAPSYTYIYSENNGYAPKRDTPAQNRSVPAANPTYIDHQNNSSPKRKDSPVNATAVLTVLGAMFISLAGIVFAAAAWGHLNSGMRTGVLLSFALLFFIFHAAAERRLHLDMTGKAFYVLGTVYLPAAVIAAAVMRLFGDTFAFTESGSPLVISVVFAPLCICAFIGAGHYSSRLFAAVGLISLSGSIASILRFLTDDSGIFSLFLAVYSLAVIAAEPLISEKITCKPIADSLKQFPLYNTLLLAAAVLFISGTGYVSLAASVIFALCFLTKRFRSSNGIILFTVLMAAGIIRGFLPDSFLDFIGVSAALSLIHFILGICGILSPRAEKIFSKISLAFSAVTVLIGFILNIAFPQDNANQTLSVTIIAAVIFIQLVIMHTREKSDIYSSAAYLSFVWMIYSASALASPAVSIAVSCGGVLLYCLISHSSRLEKYIGFDCGEKASLVKSDILAPILTAAFMIIGFAGKIDFSLVLLIGSVTVFAQMLFLTFGGFYGNSEFVRVMLFGSFAALIGSVFYMAFGEDGWYIPALTVLCAFYLVISLAPFCEKAYCDKTEILFPLTVIIFTAINKTYFDIAAIIVALQCLLLFFGKKKIRFLDLSFLGFSLASFFFEKRMAVCTCAPIIYITVLYLLRTVPFAAGLVKSDNLRQEKGTGIFLNLSAAVMMLYAAVYCNDDTNLSAALFFLSISVQLVFFVIGSENRTKRIFASVLYGTLTVAVTNFLTLIWGETDRAFIMSLGFSLILYGVTMLIPTVRKSFGSEFNSVLFILFTVICARICAPTPDPAAVFFTAVLLMLICRCLAMPMSKASFLLIPLSGLSAFFLARELSENVYLIYTLPTSVMLILLLVSYIPKVHASLYSRLSGTFCVIMSVGFALSAPHRHGYALISLGLMLFAALLSMLLSTWDRKSGKIIRILSPIVLIGIYFPLTYITDNISTAFRITAFAVFLAAVAVQSFKRLGCLSRHYTVALCAMNLLSVLPAMVHMQFFFEIPLFTALYFLIRMISTSGNWESGKKEFYCLLTFLTISALYCGGYAYGNEYMTAIPCTVLLLMFLAHKILESNTEDLPLIGCIPEYLYWAMPVASAAAALCTVSSLSPMLFIWGLLTALCTWSLSVQKGVTLTLYPVLLSTAAAAVMLFGEATSYGLVCCCTAAIYMGIGRLLYRDGVLNQLKNSDSFTVCGGMLSLSLFSIVSDLFRWIGLVLAALMFLSLIREKTPALRKSVFFTLSLIFAVSVWQNQPFWTIPEIIEREYLLLPCAAAAVMLKYIWRERENAAYTVTYIIICVISAILLLDAVKTEVVFDAVFIGTALIIMLAFAFFSKRKRWLAASAAGITAQAVLFTLKLYGSMAWWIYLLIAGVILIAAGIANERRKQRHNSEDYVSEWRW